MPRQQPPPSAVLHRPAVVELEHPELSPAGLFQLAYVLDGYELRRDPEDPRRTLKDSFTIDVLDMTPSSTTIRLTPRRSMSYLDVQTRVQELLRNAPRGIFSDHMRIRRITWENQTQASLPPAAEAESA